MENKGRLIKDSLIIGLALFATYFGAGNLIFPPALGLESGSSWIAATIGFMISGVTLPILGLIVIAHSGGSVEKLTRPINKNFYKYILIVIMIFSSLVAVPRTGAVATELGVQAIFPQAPTFLMVLIFFGLTYYLGNDKTNVINKIGTWLTPALVAILVFIIVKGFVSPVGIAVETSIANPFSNAFLGGYQTGDLFVTYMVASVFLFDIANKGYKKEKDRNKIIINAGVIAFICLLFIYGGLTFIGSSGSSLFPVDMERTSLLVALVNNILGKTGISLLSIVVYLACLTTSIGLTSSAAGFFTELSKNKISYKFNMAIVCIIGALIALLGVDRIVVISNPIFLALYPTCIVVVFLGLLDKYIPNHGSYKGAVSFTIIISIIEALLAIGFKSEILNNIISIIPFSNEGFAWVIPAIIGFTIGSIAVGVSSNKDTTPIKN